jgi:hypothetical protein
MAAVATLLADRRFATRSERTVRICPGPTLGQRVPRMRRVHGPAPGCLTSPHAGLVWTRATSGPQFQDESEFRIRGPFLN